MHDCTFNPDLASTILAKLPKIVSLLKRELCWSTAATTILFWKQWFAPFLCVFVWNFRKIFTSFPLGEIFSTNRNTIFHANLLSRLEKQNLNLSFESKFVDGDAIVKNNSRYENVFFIVFPTTLHLHFLYFQLMFVRSFNFMPFKWTFSVLSSFWTLDLLVWHRLIDMRIWFVNISFSSNSSRDWLT